MPFKKGERNPNAGRKTGSVNKGTEALRKRIAALTEKNYPRLSEAMLMVEAQDPGKFVELYLKLLQYTLPKLENVQQTIDYSDETISKISIEVVKQRTDGPKPTGDSSL